MTEGTFCGVEMNWVLGEFCYKKKHDLYINNTFQGTDSLPFLIIPILFLNFLQFFSNPLPTRDPKVGGSVILCHSPLFVSQLCSPHASIGQGCSLSGDQQQILEQNLDAL